MTTKIFVNLPIKDLKRSMDFFTALGFSFNPKFTDDKAACLVIGENIYAMLLTEPFFKDFLPNAEIADATKVAEALIAIDVESRDAVDAMVKKAVAAGGKTYRGPQQEGEWMYGHAFMDPDGHRWEVFTMDESKMPEGGASAST